MEDLMKVIKEANAEVTKIMDFGDIEFPTKNQVKDALPKLVEAIKPLYEKVKDQISEAEFTNLCILDMQYNFIGGGLINPNEHKDTIIEIK